MSDHDAPGTLPATDKARVRDRRRRQRAGDLLLLLLLLLGLALGGAAFLWAIGIDALNLRNDFNFFADSSTYHEAARGELVGIDGFNDFIGIAGNFLGPLLILAICGQDYYAVLLFNLVLFYTSVVLISRAVEAPPLKLALLLLLNPMTISSLLSVNKEILSMLVVAVLLVAQQRRSIALWIIAGAIALLVRWQLTLVLLTVFLIDSGLNPLARRRGQAAIAMLLGLSVTYTALIEVFSGIRAVFELSVEDYEGSGLYEALVDWQDRGLYWLVFPAKAAHLLFGLGLRFDRLVAPDNLYNDVWQLLHSTTTLIAFVLLQRRGRVQLGNDLVFVSVIYIMIFALSPIYAPRYFYAVFVLWTAALAARSDRPRLLRMSPIEPVRRRRAGRPAVPMETTAVVGS